MRDGPEELSPTDIDRLKELETNLRPSGIRSTTPWFADRQTTTGHARDRRGRIYRTLFQHDRDKIFYSKYFRHLRLKTQIFPENTADDLRTRMDHTLEVFQIAGHFARQLHLNHDLAEAIALAHDLGHTPFGHSGERALHRFLYERERLKKKAEEDSKKAVGTDPFDGFKHNWQGLRVVDLLEKSYLGAPGLNLTNAVRLGILNHTSLTWSERKDPVGKSEWWSHDRCTCDMKDVSRFRSSPDAPENAAFEIQIAALSDDIAQAIHDFEDAVISEEYDLELLVRHHRDDPFPLIGYCIECIREREKIDLEKDVNFRDRGQRSQLLARLRSEMIFQLTTEFLANIETKIRVWERSPSGGGVDWAEILKCRNKGDETHTSLERGIEALNKHVWNEKDFPNVVPQEDAVQMGESTAVAQFYDLKKTLAEKVLLSERVGRMDGKADYLLRHILDVYLTSPKQVPQSVLDQFYRLSGGTHEENVRGWPRERLDELRYNKTYVRAVDYVAGMTDRFALREYDLLYDAYPRAEQ